MHHFRKLICSFVVMVCLSIVAGAASAQTSIAGHWDGAIEIPGSPLGLQVDVKAADGKLSATFTIPAQGARDIPLTNVSFSGGNAGEFAFTMPDVPGTPQFKGKLSADGQKLAGTFTQGGQSFPCNLERKEAGAQAKAALDGLDAVIADAMKKFEVPGMAIAVVKGKEVVWAKGYGQRDTEKNLPVTADTLFAIGSSSKAFATFVLGTLVDEGKVEWDKPLRNYLPWFKLYDPSMTERLSVRDLVTHRSGLPRHDLIWYGNFSASRETLVRKLAYLEPSADLREKWQYNNLMFLTAGYLTEVLTGKSWEDAVRQRVFAPLNMTRSNFSVLDSQKDADFAQPYEKKDDKIVKMPFRTITNIAPAGSINSSVNEMAHWVIAHLNGGKYGDKKVAEATTVSELHKPQMVTGAVSTTPEISGGEYALGWFVDNYRGHVRVQHGGNIDGFAANVVLFPKDDFGLVILTNLNGTALRDLMANVIADRVLKLDARPWIEKAAEQRAKSEKANKEGAAKKTATRVANTSASHKLEDYVGEYEHPGYGVLTVAVRDNKLTATFNGIVTPLEHWHYDTFNGGKAADDTFEDMKFNFATDVNGFIARVSAAFEPAVSEIVFKKKPDARWSDAAYLARFVGEYDLMGQAIKIALKGNALVANVGGQPQYDLVPMLSGDFTLKQAQVVSLHFLVEGQQANAVELRQPGTVLTAKRKN